MFKSDKLPLPSSAKNYDIFYYSNLNILSQADPNSTFVYGKKLSELGDVYFITPKEAKFTY